MWVNAELRGSRPSLRPALPVIKGSRKRRGTLPSLHLFPTGPAAHPGRRSMRPGRVRRLPCLPGITGGIRRREFAPDCAWRHPAPVPGTSRWRVRRGPGRPKRCLRPAGLRRGVPRGRPDAHFLTFVCRASTSAQRARHASLSDLGSAYRAASSRSPENAGPTARASTAAVTRRGRGACPAPTSFGKPRDRPRATGGPAVANGPARRRRATVGQAARRSWASSV